MHQIQKINRIWVNVLSNGAVIGSYFYGCHAQFSAFRDLVTERAINKVVHRVITKAGTHPEIARMKGIFALLENVKPLMALSAARVGGYASAVVITSILPLAIYIVYEGFIRANLPFVLPVQELANA